MSSKKQIISASEIGQFHYCSMSWYLQKCGYKPISQRLDIGLQQHKKLGFTIDYVNKNLKRSRLLATIGYLIFFICIIFIILEVI